MQSVREFLERFRVVNLKQSQVSALSDSKGHIAGEEKLQPVPENVTAIQRFAPTTIKKQVRSFLELVGCYRKFIPKFSAIVVPLTDLTRKGQPNKIIWKEQQESALRTNGNIGFKITRCE